MILFLTSSPTGDLDGKYTCEAFDTRNNFAEEVRKYWRKQARVLMITASPDNPSVNAEMKAFFHAAVLKTGLSCSKFDFWDADILKEESLHTKEVLHSYDVVILGGGHVPTQKAFFEKLHLRENMQDFDGIVIGISAGTMNCADLVYAQPEEAGEATDPDYQRFIKGLGLTNINIVPHYQVTKEYRVDGLKLFEEITFPDSMGKAFLVLPDGSFVVDRKGATRLGDGSWLEEGNAIVHGEAYLIKDGEMRLICENGQVKREY